LYKLSKECYFSLTTAAVISKSKLE